MTAKLYNNSMTEIVGGSEISCTNCVAACCRASTSMMLEHDEAYRNRRSMSLGTLVKERNRPQLVGVPVEIIDADGRRGREVRPMRLPPKTGFYLLLEDCGNLTEDNMCGVYEERPNACANYQVGSQECLDARAVFGLDGHEAQQELGMVISAESVKTMKAPPPGLEHRVPGLF